jgi:uncharacterized protein (DUF433 family)
MIGADVVREREGICGGYPCVGNSRIPVSSLVLTHRALGTMHLVLEAYPSLTPDQIRGALAWYLEHPARVDEDIESNEQALRELSRQP